MTDVLERPVSGAEPPNVLKRVVTTPPGAPWEQNRGAQLEARHSAPLPLSELVFRVRRLSRWAPGQPGRFAVFYVRTRELNGPYETQVEIDGQSVRVAFGGAPARSRAFSDWTAVLIGLAATGAVIGGGVTLALGARAQTTERMEAAERLAHAKLASAKGYRRDAAEAEGLRTALGRARSIDDLMSDLAWAAAARSPDAKLSALHWQGGAMAVEVRGEGAPFVASDRHVERGPRPLRPGTWLWGVGPASGRSGAP